MTTSDSPRGTSGPNPDLTGSTVGRYRILRPLGVGGMGTVYLAEHLTLGRRTAVKVLNPAMARDPDALARFRREARNASTIEHPNVCAVYDFGDTPDGLTFLAMEYIEGRTLSSVLQEAGGRIPVARAVEIVRQVAAGLDAAHARGIVHRDLKPANIMITADARGRESVKVLDFGIAKAAAGGEGQEVTRVGLVAGTPQYMSPEHISGDEPDPRSDVYSLAVVFFRAVTGKLPFQADSQAELLRKILTERPQRLSEACPGLDVPAGVQEVLDRALSRDRSRRPDSAGELAGELEAAVAGQVAAPSVAAAPVAAGAPVAAAAAPAEESARPPRSSRAPERGKGEGGAAAGQAPPLPGPFGPIRRPISPRVWVGIGGGAAVVAIAIVALLVTRGGGGGGEGSAAAVTLDPPVIELAPGDSVRIQATVTDAAGGVVEAASPVWVSEDLGVAAVGPNGLVTAMGPGTTRVAARVGETRGFATVTVRGSTAASVQVAPASLRLEQGESAVLRATVLDEAGEPMEDLPVRWSSDRPGVVAVDVGGRARALEVGSATVRAEVPGGAAGTAEVRVVARAEPPPGPAVRPEDAPTVLPSMLALSDSAPPDRLMEARRQAEAFWNLGDALEPRYRALAAYLVGWTSTVLKDRSFEVVDQWLSRAVELDPRESYRQALAEHRRRRR